MKRSYLCLSVLCAAALLCRPALAEPGVPQDAIVPGQVAAGIAGLGGREFRERLLIGFKEANSAGGRKPRCQSSEWARNHAIG